MMLIARAGTLLGGGGADGGGGVDDGLSRGRRALLRTSQRNYEERRKDNDDSLSLCYDTMWLTDWSNHGPLLLMFAKVRTDEKPRSV